MVNVPATDTYFNKDDPTFLGEKDTNTHYNTSSHISFKPYNLKTIFPQIAKVHFFMLTLSYMGFLNYFKKKSGAYYILSHEMMIIRTHFID